jgi:hypothetical protein
MVIISCGFGRFATVRSLLTKINSHTLKILTVISQLNIIITIVPARNLYLCHGYADNFITAVIAIIKNIVFNSKSCV